MEYTSLTDIGKLRSHNEDSVAVAKKDNGQLLALVADGMGGHQAGDVASKLAKKVLLESWQSNDSLLSQEEAEDFLRTTVVKANKHILDYANEHTDCKGMGTTLVATICTDSFISFCHVGDSRIYLYEENELTQLTKDHSLVGELVRRGEISEQEAEVHPRKNVLMRALGTEPTIEIDTGVVAWNSGSLLVLCTDGLTNKLSAMDLSAIFNDQEIPLEEAARAMINEANNRGGEDNITVALVRHQKEVNAS
ncbi:Stp1/IreP family PP2C-type Ser/Thr phosphatase [Paenalkalicoccus suaedae]|uniref:Stp1/IreP family PP2C-type Ser/Thr phosphatase n=1 Tax=Paenalkalicoccus suaedae TaxID=2592382 RepID=UPI00201C36B9|nr:Stp1/IreP family PP2C-type Ser/Thr phosphatase [Paenalkalicoccus suaedae]